MTPPHEDEHRTRLAAFIEGRREELRLTWNEVAVLAGLSKEGLRNLRTGRTGAIRPLTRRGLEDALRWETGSVTAILAGGEPVAKAELDPDVRGPNETGIEWMDRQYELWKQDRDKRALLKGLFESWGERHAG